MKELTECQQCGITFNFPVNCNIVPSRYGVIVTCLKCYAWNLVKNYQLMK